MSKDFKIDPVGAILEFLYLTRESNKNKYTERSDWERTNVSNHIPVGWNGSIEPLEFYHLIMGQQRVDSKRAQINRIFNKLEQHDLLERNPNDDNPNSLKKTITLLGEELLLSNRYLEYIKGLQYIREEWRKSVAKIFVPDERGIGTGFLISSNKVVTAKHVVDELKNFKIQFEDDDRIYEPHKIYRPNKIDDLDIAIIELPTEIKYISPFTISIDRNILDDVLIMGYPPIPMSDDCYMIAGKGEVSAIITKYTNNIQHIVVSTLIRGGNSGGPIINHRGDVIGIVTENLYNKINPEQDGLNEGLGFSIGIVAEWIEDLFHGRI